MAKASVIITCSVCGTEFRHEKDCMNREQADSYEAWAASHITTCSDCWKKAQREKALQEQKQLAENAQDALELSGITLPDLTGTEKQIAWAETIRKIAAGDLIMCGAKDPAWVLFKSMTYAAWWIEHRDVITESRDVSAVTRMKSLLRSMKLIKNAQFGESVKEESQC